MKPRVALLMVCWMALCNSDVDAQAVPPWKIGDGWQLAVELSALDDKEKPKPDETDKGVHRYTMHVVILGTEKVDGANCWKVDFLIPEKKLPAGLTGRYRVCVDAEDGWPRKAFSFRDYRNLPFEQFDKGRALTKIPDGYPVEMFPAVELRPANGAKSPFSLTVTTNTATGMRTAILRNGEEKEIEIRQTWKEGENWWREYERYRNGKLDLRARLVPKVVAKAPPPDPTPAETPKLTSTTKPSPVTYIDQTQNPLRSDARLQATVTLNAGEPTVQDILNRLGKATGITFTTEEDADTSTPVFASISWVNVPAWSAMDQLARSSKIKGRWEKIDGGYRLEGVPQSLRPPPPATNYGWAWAAGGLLLTLATAGGAFVIYRRRGNNPVASPGKQVAPVQSPASKKKPT